MKKISLFIIIAFALSLLPFDTIAQQKALKKGYSTTNWCVSGVSKKGKKSGSSSTVGSSNMFFGIKGGVNFASMSYVGLNPDYTVQRLLLPFGGIFFEYDNPSGLSIIPTLLFKEDGTGLTDKANTKYQLVTKNIDFTLPIAYDIYITENFAPFIYIAPDISFRILGDEITYDKGNKGSSCYSSFNYGAKAGLGLKYILNLGSLKWLIRLDGAYNFGLSNTFDKSKLGQDGYPIKDMWKDGVSATRKNRGIEVGLSLGIGL
ncbi:MAG: outer membrane beta-barrel protein [Bacteroidales bacterium]|nr:outer membrane beta-barrel protein [Bacteroidales bacterium]